MSLMFSGIGVSRGIAIGDAYILRRDRPEINDRRLKPREIPTEVKRYRKALVAAKKQLEQVRETIPKNASSDVSAFIEAHLLMIDDTVLADGPVEILKAQACSAEAALENQRLELQKIFNEMEDPYIATRMDDVNHVIDQIMQVLVDSQHESKKKTKDTTNWKGLIVIADDLTPADTIVMQNQGVAGFVTETGGQLSHTAILARSLGIPAIVGIHNLRDYIKPGEQLILHGESGMVLAEPQTQMIDSYKKQRRQLLDQQRELRKLVDTPAITTDGIELSLMANIEIDEDIKALKRVNADGVGLYRTEFLYMNRDDIPDENEHFYVYTKVARALKGAPLTIRIADLGADKQTGAEITGPLAHNPAMGLRGVRLALSDTSLITPQLAAILRVSAKAPVSIMIPMLTNLHEVEQCLELIEHAKSLLSERRLKFDNDIAVGGMIEVPAAAIAADQFAEVLDFLSIGTNDLIQYTLAIDRIDDRVNYLYDPLHPAVLQLIKLTIDAGKRADIPVAMCGEMAGNPRFVRLLLGLGLTEFSMPPNSLLEVKRALLGSHSQRLHKPSNALLKCSSPDEQQKLLAKINGTDANKTERNKAGRSAKSVKSNKAAASR